MIRRWGLVGTTALIGVFAGGLLWSRAFANDLTYQTRVPVEFTFNDTLSLTVSGDIAIPRLFPGSFMDSNIVTVTVGTNNAYGYTLSATVGNSANASRELRKADYAGTGDSVFSNLAIGAGLTREVFSSNSSYDNYWGFSTNKVGSAYSGKYNGLPLYNDLTAGAVVLDYSGYMPSGGSSTTDFWIGAKASANKEAGVYTNVINFIAVGGVASRNLEDAYAAAGKTKVNVNGGSYYKMQDMNSSICAMVEVLDSSIQAVDIRDNKIYWITKLRDGHCWMTQNLDLDLDSSATYTHADTDLGWGSDTATTSWMPARSTIDATGGSIDGWANDDNTPYSVRINSEYEKIGNYYNWSATVASNNTSGYSTSTYDNVTGNPQNSICPAGWRLPTISSASNAIEGSTNEFSRINRLYNNALSNTSEGLESAPLFFIRGGYIYDGLLRYSGSSGYYWSSTPNRGTSSYLLYFNISIVSPTNSSARGGGRLVRCVAR